MTAHETYEDPAGFTLIELLIVVVILGILAAIAIPQFSNTKEKAFDAAAKSDLRNLMSAQETYFAEFQEYAPDVSSLGSETRFNQTNGVTITMTRPGGAEYLADAAHTKSTACFRVHMGAAGEEEIILVPSSSAGSGNCGG